MRTLEKRINKVEITARHRASDLSLLSDAELGQRLGAILARMGTTREKVIAEHGSLRAFTDVLREREAHHGTA